MARFEEMRQASTEIDVESETETEKTMESKTKDNKKTPAGANAGKAALEMTASWEKKAFHPLLVGLGIKGIKHLKKKYDEDEDFRAKVDGAVGDFADLGKALVQRGTEALLGDDDATTRAASFDKSSAPSTGMDWVLDPRSLRPKMYEGGTGDDTEDWLNLHPQGQWISKEDRKEMKPYTRINPKEKTHQECDWHSSAVEGCCEEVEYNVPPDPCLNCDIQFSTWGNKTKHDKTWSGREAEHAQVSTPRKSLRRMDEARRERAKSASSEGMSVYIDVLSNDMLKHKSLPSSPETLCGKIVADTFRPSAIDEMCDICMTLGDGFVNEAKTAMRADDDCGLCHGTGKVGTSACDCTEGFNTRGMQPDSGVVKMMDDEMVGTKTAQAKPQRDFSEEEAYGEPNDDEDYNPDDDDDDDDDVSWGLDEGDYELPDGDDAGTFINSVDDDDDDEEEEGETSGGGYFGLDDDSASLEDSVMDFFSENPHELEEFINYLTKRKGGKEAAAAKIALNYTLDGKKIVDGFKVMLTSQEANSLPYLDTNRVTISEKITCSDCKEPSWLQTVASCSDCNQFKCATCMESMRDFSGICRRCANTIDGTIGDESPVIERDMYFEYFLNSETETPLFLPEGE